MSLTTKQKQNIEETLRVSLRNKFQNYNPEPAVMPFHTRLLGKDRLALYSFIHSLNTSFGTSIFEPVALALGKTQFDNANNQATAGKFITKKAEEVIQDIMNNLIAGRTKPNKAEEIERIRKVCQEGEMIEIKPTKVDVYFSNNDNTYYLFDIKTAKPNMGGFKEFKRTLLEWVAVTLSENPEANINTLIAIPYNPYEPKPYSRWTMAGMLDLEKELKVANEFWDFIGGEGVYNDLLNCFERIGIEMREEIDEYFLRY
jgi:type II restriction enzyme